MPNPRRRLALIALTAVFIVAGAATAGWWWLDGRWHTSTDDAYVQGNLVQLTPQIAGIVIRINADDTALVREGDPVVVLDNADTRTALDEARAGLAQAVRRVRQLYANTGALRASVELRRADWRAADRDRAPRGRLGRGELQGNAAGIRPQRPAGQAHLRPVWRRSHVSRHRYRARVGHG